MLEYIMEIIAMVFVLIMIVTVVLGLVVILEVFNFLNNYGVAQVGPSRVIAFGVVAGVFLLGVYKIHRRYREFQNY